MAANAGTPVLGRRKHHRRKVMSEINVTPMVDVMLVLLIIFMVSAPLLTVGVPIDLPQSEAKSLEQDKEPLIFGQRQGPFSAKYRNRRQRSAPLQAVAQALGH
jgi:biopolymer transport protein ExbD